MEMQKYNGETVDVTKIDPEMIAQIMAGAQADSEA